MFGELNCNCFLALFGLELNDNFEGEVFGDDINDFVGEIFGEDMNDFAGEIFGEDINDFVGGFVTSKALAVEIRIRFLLNRFLYRV